MPADEGRSADDDLVDLPPAYRITHDDRAAARRLLRRTRPAAMAYFLFTVVLPPVLMGAAGVIAVLSDPAPHLEDAWFPVVLAAPFAVLSLVARPWDLRRKSRRLAALGYDRVRYAIDDDHFHIGVEGAQVLHVPWRAVPRYDEDERIALVRVRVARAGEPFSYRSHFVPRAALDEDGWERLRVLATAGIAWRPPETDAVEHPRRPWDGR